MRGVAGEYRGGSGKGARSKRGWAGRLFQQKCAFEPDVRTAGVKEQKKVTEIAYLRKRGVSTIS